MLGVYPAEYVGCKGGNRLFTACSVQAIRMSLEKQLVKLPKSESREGVLLLLELGKQFRTYLFCFLGIKRGGQDDIPEQVKARLKKTGQKICFESKCIFSVKS